MNCFFQNWSNIVLRLNIRIWLHMWNIDAFTWFSIRHNIIPWLKGYLYRLYVCVNKEFKDIMYMYNKLNVMTNYDVPRRNIYVFLAFPWNFSIFRELRNFHVLSVHLWWNFVKHGSSRLFWQNICKIATAFCYTDFT